MSATASRIGTTDNKLTLAVYANEGNQPHFHFYHFPKIDNQTAKSSGCLMIGQSMYFEHNTYTEKLNSTERKELGF
ncbi:hypothetical protein LQZ18_02490 [Lachnospiraceae bacterium ZAX-1]